MAENTVVVNRNRHHITEPRVIVTQDDCVNIVNEVADGAFYKMPLLAHALVNYLCDEMPQNASVHEATQHIAERGVGVLQRLPVEAIAKKNAFESVYRLFVLGAALCGVGLVCRIACSAPMLLFIYNRFGPTPFEKKCARYASFAWIVACAWRSASVHSKIDVSLGLIALMYA